MTTNEHNSECNTRENGTVAYATESRPFCSMMEDGHLNKSLKPYSFPIKQFVSMFRNSEDPTN